MKKRKTYEEPGLEIIVLEQPDVIVTSGTELPPE